MTVYIFGAGSTRGTLNDSAPVSREFGAKLDPDSYPNLAKAARYLSPKEPCLNKQGLEELWSFVDYYAKFCVRRGGFLEHNDWLEPAIGELKRAILAIYGKGCEAAAAKITGSSRCTLVSIIKGVKEGDAIISFNYDTLVETLGMRMGLPLVHGGTRCQGAHKVQFAKPHGSTSWGVGGPHPPPVGEPLLDSLAPEDVKDKDRDPKSEPLVLGAVPIKSELISEVQYHYGACDVFKLIMRQWEVVMESVRAADRVVVVGYGFPKEDHHGRFLFLEAGRRRHVPLKRVEYYSKNDDCHAAIREVFGSDCEVISRGEVLSQEGK
ncbi:MAG: hypothetical protein JNN08_10955 [Bryobacterales bacterium]|nr:hypothetical protein [Bryobacterales bacterium]